MNHRRYAAAVVKSNHAFSLRDMLYNSTRGGVNLIITHYNAYLLLLTRYSLSVISSHF